MSWEHGRLQAQLQAAEGDLETSEQIRAMETKRADEAQEEAMTLRDGLQAAECEVLNLRQQLETAQARARAGEVGTSNSTYRNILR